MSERVAWALHAACVFFLCEDSSLSLRLLQCDIKNLQKIKDALLTVSQECDISEGKCCSQRDFALNTWSCFPCHQLAADVHK